MKHKQTIFSERKGERKPLTLMGGIFLLIALSLFLFPSVTAFDFPHTIVNLDYTGNLTNLSEMQDVNIPSPSNGQVLKFDSSSSTWLAGADAGGTDTNASTACSGEEYLAGNGSCLDVGSIGGDTNETTRVDTMVGTNCGTGDYAYGFDSSGNIECREDTTGAGGTDTNASTACGDGEFLNGDGTCDTGYLDADGVDDDTTYINGTGLNLIGDTFSITLSYFQGLFLQLSGGTMGGDIDMGDNSLTDVNTVNITNITYIHSIQSSSGNSIEIQPTGDEDDFFTFKTPLDRPTIKREGGKFIYFESSNLYDAGISFRDDDTYSGTISYAKDDHIFKILGKDSPVAIVPNSEYYNYILLETYNHQPQISVFNGTVLKINDSLNVIGNGSFSGNITAQYYCNSTNCYEVGDFLSGGTGDNESWNQSLANTLYRADSWDNFTGIPTATPSDGDTTHLSTAGQIYAWVIGLGYSTTTYVDNLIASVGNWSEDKSDYWNTSEDLLFSTDLNTTGNITAGFILGDGSQLSNLPAGTTYSHLTNFTDDLGDRGYTHLTNFTDDILWTTEFNNTFDSRDSDTTYLNGIGLDLNASDYFSILLGYRMPQSCNDGEIAEYNTTSGGWDCAIDNSAASGMASWVLAAEDTGGSESITDGETVTFADDEYLNATRSTNTITYSMNEAKLNETIDDRDSDTTYSDLSEFNDNLGDRGYTSNSNFTNDEGYLTSYTESDPLWTANYTAYNNSWSSTFNDTYDGYNSTGLIKNWNADGYIQDWNATGLIMNWSGDYLTEETDPFAYNGTLAYLSDILSFGYYNLSDFDIADYYLKTETYSVTEINNNLTNQDECSEITGCIENAITDGNTNWDNSYGFITSADDSVNTTELDGVCSTDDKILKRVSGTWQCADESAGVTDTNASTACSAGEFLNGDGTCDTGYLDADGIDSDSNLTETDVDSYVSDNGYALLSTILGFNYYNSSDFIISDYALDSKVDSLGNFSDWDKDYNDLINAPTTLSDFTDDILWTTEFNSTGDSRWSGGIDTNASTACSGTTTYLDGENNCNDISLVYYDSESDLTGLLNDNYADISITGDNESWNQSLANTLYRADSWDNFTGIPTATPSNGDTTHLSTAGQIYAWVIGLGYWNPSTDLDTVIDADEIDESKIGLTTTCGTGNHLYINGNDFACEADEDNQLTEDQVEAFVFDNDNTDNLNMSDYNVTSVDCIVFTNGAELCGV